MCIPFVKQEPALVQMMLLSCINQSPCCRVLVLAALITYSTLPLTAHCHPDLLLQIETLDKKIESDPVTSELLIRRGDLYRRHEDFESAARDFQYARQLDPQNPLLDFYEGRLFLETGDPASAELYLSRYTSSNPHHAKAWILRGQAGVRLGQAGLAAEYFELAIQNSKAPSPGLYCMQILSLLAMGEPHWQSAGQLAAKGLEHFGSEISLLGLATDISLARDQLEEARFYLEKLPQALQNLSQWRQRIKTAQCMETSGEPGRLECLQFAENNLLDQVRSFQLESL